MYKKKIHPKWLLTVLVFSLLKWPDYCHHNTPPPKKKVPLGEILVSTKVL